MIAVVLKLAPVLLALVMLGMGLTLTVADFARVVRVPRAAAVGLFGQIVVLPLLAFALVSLLPLTPEVAVGVMILAACPGGPGSNLVALLANGDAALSVTLTAVNSLLGLVTVPAMAAFATARWLGAGAQLSPGQVAGIAVGASVLTVVPTMIGMGVRRARPAWAERAGRPVRLAALGVLLLLIVGVAVEQGSELASLLAQAGLVDVLLCVAAMSVAGGLATGAGLEGAQRRTVVIEVGVQNGALALLVTQQLLDNTQMAVPVLVYSPVMLTASLLMIAWGSRQGS